MIIAKMENFIKRKGDIVKAENPEYEDIIKEWGELIFEQSQKGLVPLFITGSGVSIGADIPDISGIIRMLKKLYEENKKNDQDINKLFEIWEAHEKAQKKDRSVVAKLLRAFQEKNDLKDIWKEFNRELLDKILSVTGPHLFHKMLAELYDKFNAVCLTLNFDGLLIREFVQFRRNDDERAFSLPIKEECERFFLRNPEPEKRDKKEFLEIQIRGDILYVTCEAKGFCPLKGKKRPVWASIASYIVPSEKGKIRDTISISDLKDKLLKCPSCGEQGVSLLSFPGSYEKEKDMKDMLEVVWKYLAFRVGSVTVVGMSGEWDPLMIAFLGDLLSEREIPLLVVDKHPEVNKSGKIEPTYIIRELVKPGSHNAVALQASADEFMDILNQKLLSMENLQKSQHIEFKIPPERDGYWDKLIDETKTNQLSNEEKAKIQRLKESIDLEFSNLENALRNKLKEKGLENFAQLGLKSHWLGISSDHAKYHKRYHHSLGVMKIATYLYDRAVENSGLDKNPRERQFLRLAALLHDIGHLPFSHLIENIFNELNWKPAGYKDYYSHLFQTNKEIEGLFNNNNNLKNGLSEIGYTVKDLINLVNGCFGVGYLDAIINSPLDADKIDYVFRDTYCTDRKISLAPIQFLKDFAESLRITPEKSLAFSGISAKAAGELLHARRHLYQNLYLQPGIVILEGIVKLIIKTYFIHYLRFDSEEILNKLKADFNKRDYPDLGEYKISYCIAELEKLCEEAKSSDNIELEIVKLIFEKIKEKKKIFCNDFWNNIQKGFETIVNINSEDKLKELETKIIYKRFNRNQEREIKDLIKDVMLRIPGAAIIEMSKSKFLSSADSRKEKERSDGTKTFAECILVPDGDYKLWTSTSEANKPLHDSSLKDIPDEDISVYLYPLSGNPDDSSFKQALNLFKKLSDKKG